MAALASTLGLAWQPAPAASSRTPAAWSPWQAFKRSFISADGRVVDPSTPHRHSTSEGQAYALFFALVAGEREDFARLLDWTENNLAGGDLGARLPAWQWGRRDDGRWTVLDANAASDADLWLVYVLEEAARLWRNDRWHRLAEQLATRVLREETAVVSGLGRVLMPAPYGFGPSVQNGVMRVRLNPSYAPIPVLRRLSVLTGSADWAELLQTSVRLLTDGAPRGLAADWVTLEHHPGGQLRWLPGPAEEDRIGSYNAIRVYLWLGLTADGEALLPGLLDHYQPMLNHIEQRGSVPLHTDASTGTATGEGPPGFTAAVLPFVERHGRPRLAAQLSSSLLTTPPASDAYYEQALTLFASGFRDGLFHFKADGALKPSWT